MGVRLGRSSQNICLGNYWKRVTKKYWSTLKQKPTISNEILPSKFGIGRGGGVTSMYLISGKLISNNPKNMNHKHKDSKDLFSVIITQGKYKRGGENVFYDGVKISGLGSRARVLKHLHGRMIFASLEKYFHEGTLWRGPRSVISSILAKNILYISIIVEISFITNISIK